MSPFRPAPWLRVLALCLLPALVAHVVAGALDLHRGLAGWTGPVAWLRPDALPFSLLVLALAAAALAVWGRMRLGRELAARDAAERRSGYTVHHDELTRLPNRTLLCDRLQQSLHVARRAGSRVGLLALDLARLRDVNDALGRAAGDLLLVQVAERLRACARASDTVARIGGDRFAVILPQVGHPADATPAAERILGELARPFDLNGQEVRIAASVGITVFPDDGATPEELFRNVDLALYEAKEEGVRSGWGIAAAGAAGPAGTGPDGYRFFLPDMRAKVEARRALEAQLRSAVAREEFALHYQPVVGIADGRVGHVEALLRWNHPERGLLAPHGFLAAAEASGLIVPIGDWMLRAACAQARAWQDAGMPLRVSVNVTRPQLLRPDFVAGLAEALAAAGLEADALELEVGEAAFARRGGEVALERLRELRRMGVQLAFDDFGTGASSIALLKRFPGRRVKIDRSFVRDMLRDPEDAAIVRGIINLGHSLDRRVVAEGVETEEQLDFLRVQGCDEVQGCHLAKPLPASSLTRLLQREPSKRRATAAAPATR